MKKYSFNKIFESFLLIIGMIMLAIVSLSCERKYAPREYKQEANIMPAYNGNIVLDIHDISYNHKIMLVIIDKCEYVLYHGSSQGSGKAITHHANCSNHGTD